jgi:hypothetical protein
MTITIPTCELVGILADAIPFASTDDDFPSINAVHLSWDGEQLQAQATDRIAIGRSRWYPTDEPDNTQQEDLFTRWGGGDDPWSILLPLDDARDIVTVFKLPTKEGWAPLTVEHLYDNRVKVVRSRDTGHSALTQVVEAAEAPFPVLDAILDPEPITAKIEHVALDAKQLAKFAKVRPRGPLGITFTGENRPALVAIGERFSGAIMPVRDKDPEPTEPEREVAVDDDQDELFDGEVA